MRYTTRPLSLNAAPAQPTAIANPPPPGSAQRRHSSHPIAQPARDGSSGPWPFTTYRTRPVPNGVPQKLHPRARRIARCKPWPAVRR